MAAFPGDANYQPAVSAPATFTIGQATVTVALTATSGSSSVYGGLISLIATVDTAGDTPATGGTVTFYDGAAPLAMVPVNEAGTATFTTSDLPAGANSITAAYSGDANFRRRKAAAYSETVAPTNTTVVLVQTPVSKKRKRTSTSQAPIRLTVEVTRSSTGGAVPTGEVTFELLKKAKRKTKVITLRNAA